MCTHLVQCSHLPVFVLERQCHFMSMVWFSALRRYEYAMRVDEDVCVQRFASNPFEAMRQRGLVYGFGLITSERHTETLRTMPQWLVSYIAGHDLGAEQNSSRFVEDIFFSNFFVSRIEWWFGSEVQRFLAAVADSGNIYLHRWGDAPIQTAALRLFATPTDVDRLPTDYLHVSTMDRIFIDGHATDGSADQEMLNHPIVHAHRRQLQGAAGVSNNTNCSTLNSMRQRDPCTQSSVGQHVVISFFTANLWSSLTSDVMAGLVSIYASYFGVPTNSVAVQSHLQAEGVAMTVQVDCAFGLTLIRS
jgi:hypothetical protein